MHVSDLVLNPSPHDRPGANEQFVHEPGDHLACLQLPASKGQGRT